MDGPDPTSPHPIAAHRRVGFLQPLVQRANVEIGNPAHLIRQRFDEAIIAALLDIAWRHWPIDKVRRNLDAIRGHDIEALRHAR